MAIFTIATIGVKTQIVSVSVSTCQPTTNLALYGFTFNAANVVNNGTCKNYYSTNGACVPSYQLINTLNTNNNWLFQTSLNANSYALQYINATIYFQTVNGWITTSTTVDNSNSSFSSTIGNFFKSLVNRATSLFNNVSAWIKSVFNNTASQINPCFQTPNPKPQTPTPSHDFFRRIQTHPI